MQNILTPPLGQMADEEAGRYGVGPEHHAVTRVVRAPRYHKSRIERYCQTAFNTKCEERNRYDQFPMSLLAGRSVHQSGQRGIVNSEQHALRPILQFAAGRAQRSPG